MDTNADMPHVDTLRQVMLWPIQLIPQGEDRQIQHHWDYLKAVAASTPWREIDDEFTSASAVIASS
jgi:hypothetical protein